MLPHAVAALSTVVMVCAGFLERWETRSSAAKGAALGLALLSLGLILVAVYLDVKMPLRT